ncbi:putative transcriptional regulator [Streptococcus infantarius subsp. infantarius]|nr:putative transcriptional regulator [Streptococcus infantarius subsp. infantarius]MCO4606425.1 putative transcriptional regulator [Streptococcus infantarius subsp. infantarius]
MQKMTLKMLRVANGLNQKQAAELVGVSTDTWGHWERYQTEPTISMAYHIANKFNMNLDDIIFLPKIAV